MLLAWYMCRVKGKVVMNTSSEILWFNQNIIFAKKLIFFKNWFQSGTAYIKDIFRMALLEIVNKLGMN